MWKGGSRRGPVGGGGGASRGPRSQGTVSREKYEELLDKEKKLQDIINKQNKEIALLKKGKEYYKAQFQGTKNNQRE